MSHVPVAGCALGVPGDFAPFVAFGVDVDVGSVGDVVDCFDPQLVPARFREVEFTFPDLGELFGAGESPYLLDLSLGVFGAFVGVGEEVPVRVVAVGVRCSFGWHAGFIEAAVLG